MGVQPMCNVGKDLLLVGLYQKLVTRTGIQLELDVLDTHILHALDRPAYTGALLAHGVCITSQDRTGRLLGILETNAGSCRRSRPENIL